MQFLRAGHWRNLGGHNAVVLALLCVICGSPVLVGAAPMTQTGADPVIPHSVRESGVGSRERTPLHSSPGTILRKGRAGDAAARATNFAFQFPSVLKDEE
jgi:hypothetical protein